MGLREEIQHMFEDELLTVAEIARALVLDPNYVYSVVYGK